MKNDKEFTRYLWDKTQNIESETVTITKQELERIALLAMVNSDGKSPVIIPFKSSTELYAHLKTIAQDKVGIVEGDAVYLEEVFRGEEEKDEFLSCLSEELFNEL